MNIKPHSTILLCIVTFILTGCFSTQSNYNHIYNKNTYDYIEDNKFPDILPGDLINPNSLLKIFKSIGTLNNKSDFETYEDFSLRKNNFESNDIFNKNYFVTADMNFGSYYSIKYDINIKKFNFTLKNIYLRIYSSNNTLEDSTFSSLISTSSKNKGSYTGSNVFGITKQVSLHNYNQIYINFNNSRKILNSPYYENINYEEMILGKSKDIDPKSAQSLNNNLSIVFEITPSLHYIYGNKYSLVEENSHRANPTLSSPSDIVMKNNILFCNLKAIYLINKIDKKVYGMLRF